MEPPTGTPAPPPLPPWWHLDNDNRESPCVQHVLVTSLMVLFFFVSAYNLWSAADGGFTMNAIVFLYCTAMIHLELLRQRSQSKQLHYQVMLVATGLMLVSSATAVLVFHPHWRDWSNIAIFAFLSAALVLLLFKLDHMGREDDAAASDLV